MSYNPYASNNSGGYGQPNPYGQQQQNPYAQQQQNPDAAQQPAYGAQPQPMEMQEMHTQGAAYGNGAAAPDQHAILNECLEIQRAIDEVEADQQTLQRTQRGFVNGTGATNREIDAIGADIMGTYRTLADRVKRIKSRPEAGRPQNSAQVGNLDRRIKAAIQSYQQQEAAFRKEVQDQQRRQYLIVNPEATEAELEAVSSAGGDQQIFQQALLTTNRRGQAQSTLRNVQQRHDAIQNIEKTMMELAQLFQDLDAYVVQQDPLVQNVEQRAEETQTHMVQANVQLTQATNSARAARRKKWICLGICIAIIVVVAIIVLVYGATAGGWFKKSSSKKRALLMARSLLENADVPSLAVLGRAHARALR